MNAWGRAHRDDCSAAVARGAPARTSLVRRRGRLAIAPCIRGHCGLVGATTGAALRSLESHRDLPNELDLANVIEAIEDVGDIGYGREPDRKYPDHLVLLATIVTHPRRGVGLRRSRHGTLNPTLRRRISLSMGPDSAVRRGARIDIGGRGRAGWPAGIKTGPEASPSSAGIPVPLPRLTFRPLRLISTQPPVFRSSDLYPPLNAGIMVTVEGASAADVIERCQAADARRPTTPARGISCRTRRREGRAPAPQPATEPVKTFVHTLRSSEMRLTRTNNGMIPQVSNLSSDSCETDFGLLTRGCPIEHCTL